MLHRWLSPRLHSVSDTSGRASRQVIAEAVTQDPSQYNEGMLGKPTAEYAKWILDPSKWGGAIELSILSKCESAMHSAPYITRGCLQAALHGPYCMLHAQNASILSEKMWSCVMEGLRMSRICRQHRLASIQVNTSHVTLAVNDALSCMHASERRALACMCHLSNACADSHRFAHQVLRARDCCI